MRIIDETFKMYLLSQRERKNVDDHLNLKHNKIMTRKVMSHCAPECNIKIWQGYTMWRHK